MPQPIQFDDHTCLICGYRCRNRKSLGMHLSHRHPGETIRGYVTRFFFPDGPPVCACGRCGQRVEWHRSRYAYNDYVNGHNKAGYTRVEYKETTEQRERRIIAIKETYSGDHADEIRGRIGQSVSETLAQPDVHAKLGIGIREAWKDPTRRAEMTATRRRVWAERYDELYARIFTPEFGRKISEANRRRELRRTSAAEVAFMDAMDAAGFAVDRDVWIFDPVTGSNKCFDGRLRETGELVEFDGSFWHGLDRPPEDLTEVQLLNAANDLLKNAIAERAGCGLLRFMEGTDPAAVRSLDLLRELAYLRIRADAGP